MQVIDKDWARANCTVDPAEWKRFDIEVNGYTYERDVSFHVHADIIDTKLDKRGKVSFGFKFEGNTYFSNQQYVELYKIICIAWLAGEYGYAINNFTLINTSESNNGLTLQGAGRSYIREVADTVYSWHRHLFGKDKINFKFGDLSWVCGPEKIQLPQPLNYNKAVLGRSGGKESTLCEIVLNGAGYEVVPVTYKGGEFDLSITNPTASLDVVLTLEAQEIIASFPPTLPLPGITFDTLPMVSIPRYALLAFTGMATGAGSIAVGAEFGTNGRWERGTADAEFPVNDLLSDGGTHLCQALEELFQTWGLEFQYVSPVSVLHEAGILRGLDAAGFDLAKLKSCFYAEILGVNWCGACAKCQRVKKYIFQVLKDPRYMSLPEFDFRHTRGGMAAYTMCAHLIWDNPQLPWTTALIMDTQGLKLQDHRQGYRFIKFLRETLGFTDTIYPDQVALPKLALRSGSTEETYQSIVEATGFKYMSWIHDAPEQKHNGHLNLPFENLFYSLLDVRPDWAAALPANWTSVSVVARYDRLPVWHEGKWRVLDVTGAEDGLTMPLPEITSENEHILKVWLDYNTMKPGFDLLNIETRGLLQ